MPQRTPMLVAVFSAPVFAVDAQDLAVAMEVPELDLLNASLSGPTASYGELDELGILVPQAGGTLIGLSTGRLGSLNTDPGTDWSPAGSPQGDKSQLTLTLRAPENHVASLTYDFYFLSAEYPVYVGQQFNDTFSAYITSRSYSGDAAIDSRGNPVSVNSVLFAVTTSSALQGTGFQTAGGTGWLTAQIPVEPGDTVEIAFSVQDKGDGILDSVVLLDHFQWSAEEAEDPGIQEPPRLGWLDPKRGPIEGGVETTIVGEQFRSDCVAAIDGVRVASTFIDENHFELTPLPHEPGLVDVMLDCGPNQVGTLHGGYTFWTEGTGAWPPSIVEVDPHLVGIDGGTRVLVTGISFDPAIQVAVDDVAVPVTWMTETALFFDAPPHEAGIATLSVHNPDGLVDELDGGLHYVESPYFAEESGSVSDTTVGFGCETGIHGSWFWWVLPLMARRRSRC